MTDHEKLLQETSQKRREIASKIERLRGRLDEAQSNLQNVETEIKAKKISPDQLDEAISKLEKRFENEHQKLQTAIANAESAIEPFENGDR
tara:strand:+ start:79 stop:351 length:273 start_codon:yes stop_codon:yes gene_type:complete